ncbi:MAG: RHS repeat-associated core domain-containing protein [Bacillota bacterium]|nr:RHS repeat-associated core domain-containing protein [Bacillota bacterium]
MQSRYYSPEWCRFINADTIAGKTGNLLSHNMFAYCLNNPVNHSDPNGEWVVDAIFLAADVAAFASAPSAAAAGWVLLDVLCFADPTGAASAGAHVVKTAHLVEEGVHSMSGGRKLIKFFEMNHTSGSYTVHFKSGMQYHGEGSLARARKSYRRIVKAHPEEELHHIHWTPAKSQKSGFMHEEIRLSNHGGPSNPRNYNINNSPGRRYFKY